MISKTSGAILNVNSGAGKVGFFSNLSAYCASKFGLQGLGENLAPEFNACNNNIKVLIIFIGEVATKMRQECDFSYYEKIRAKCLDLRMWQQRLLK
jgi:short-subunit dehydrogenase